MDIEEHPMAAVPQELTVDDHENERSSVYSQHQNHVVMHVEVDNENEKAVQVRITCDYYYTMIIITIDSY